MKPSDPENCPPSCTDCEESLRYDARLAVWWCISCDGSPGSALDAEYEARRDLEDERCSECDDYGDWQCRIHGPMVLEQQRAAYRMAVLTERREARARRRRPVEQRLGLLLEGHDGVSFVRWARRNVTARDLAAVCGDPLAIRWGLRVSFQLHPTRPCVRTHHDHVLEQLRDPVALP